MCRSLSTKIVLSYALREHKVVTATKLEEKRKELINTFGDVLADVSISSLRRIVREAGNGLKLSIEDPECTISREGAKLLSDRYLDVCLSGYFSDDEKSKIKKILTA